MAWDERRLVVRLTQGLGVFPWLALAVLLLGAAAVRVSLGHWPVVYRDDPQGALASLATCASLLSLVASRAVAPLVIIALAARRFHGLGPVLDRWGLSALIGALVCHIVERSDPFGYVTWLFD